MHRISFRRMIPSLLLSLSLAINACGSADTSSDVIRTDSAGIEIVVSSGINRPLEWGFHEEFSLGGTDDGPESFYRVSLGSVRADAQGNLYIMDGANSRVTVFSPEGEFIRFMGGEGGGPCVAVAQHAHRVRLWKRRPRSV